MSVEAQQEEEEEERQPGLSQELVKQATAS